MSRFFDAPMTITQYDDKDEPIGTYTDTFLNIFKKKDSFEKYYYRATALGKHETNQRVSTIHFGVRATSFGGFNLSEENFINAYLNYEIQQYAKEKKEARRITKRDFSFSYVVAHDIWYVNRMKTLSQNSQKDFSDSLKQFLDNNQIYVPIADLNECSKKPGLYLLVLSAYNVCYFGQATDIKRRIMKHWSRNDYFTGTGIDMFKAFDTSEIYVAFCNGHKEINLIEHNSITEMPSRYTLNSMSGGTVDYLLENNYSLQKEDDNSSLYTNYVREPYDWEKRVEELYHRFVVA